MHKTIPMLLIAVMSSSAAAEWSEIGGDNKVTTYIDPPTVHQSGDKATIWTMIDYRLGKDFKNDKFLSAKVKSEFDCKKKQMRNVYIFMYSRNMGAGDVLYKGKNLNLKWTPIVPGMVGDGEFRIACGK